MAVSSPKSVLLVGAAVIFAIAPAHAQNTVAAKADGDIVVTGTLQAYRGNVDLRELPQATQVISSEVLREQNITRLDTALDLSASVARQNAFGGVFDAYAIRGFVGDPDTASGFLVNGFNGARGYAGPRDASNIEAIEVLRGPTSALFGRGEPGGTVNIVTKKPFFSSEGYISASVGRFDNYRGELDYNIPLSGTIAFRVTGAYEQGDSFRDTLDFSKITTSPSILLKTDNFAASYEFEYTKQKVPFDRGVVAINGDPGVLPRSRFLGEPGDGNQEAKAVGHQLQAEYKLGGDWKILSGVGYRETWLNGFGEDPEFAAARNPFFVDGRTLSRRRIFRDYTSKDFIPRAEISGSADTVGLKHNMLLGADYEYFKLDIVQDRFRPPVLNAAQLAQVASGNVSAATRAALNAIDIFNPVYATTLPNLSPFQSRIELAKAWGVYFRDRIEITDWLAIQGGIRYDDYRQTVTQRLVPSVTRVHVTQWSPSFGFSMKASDDLTFYGSYSKGFRANTGVNVRNEAFKPETTESYEIGTKFDVMEDMLSGTIALFTMDKSNLKTADPVNAGFSLDVGKAKSKGVEVDLTAKLPADVNVILSYAYVDASIAQDILDPDFGRTIFKGDSLINVPKNSFSGTVSKKFAIGERELNLGANVRYVSKRRGETGVAYFLPGYTLVRLFGSVDITKNLGLSVDVSNLFNKEYFPSSYAALWTMPGAPREWRARVTYRF